MARCAAKVTASALPAAAVAEFGIPALAVLVLLAVLILAVICWVIVSQDRTNRVSQILLARRGTPTPQPVSAVLTEGSGLMKPILQRVTSHKNRGAR